MREPREHLKTIQRRVDFLKSRDHKNSFDHAELGSLEWALVNLQTERKPLTDEEIGKAFDNREIGLSVFGCFLAGVHFAEAAHNIKEST